MHLPSQKPDEVHFFVCRRAEFSDSQFLADVLGDGVLVDDDVHRLVGYVGLGYVPESLVGSVVAP